MGERERVPLGGVGAAGTRLGVSVVETLVALLLGLLVLSLGLAVLGRQRTVQASLSHRQALAGTVRTARHLLGTELRNAGESAAVYPPDSLTLRAFRGTGLVCRLEDPLVVWAEVGGVRLPDPEKDSVLVLTAEGRVAVRAVAWMEMVHGEGCGSPGTELARMSFTDTIPADALLLRYFERGSYHLTDGALRYRRGLGGRQPLTPEELRTRQGGFRLLAGGWLAAELVPAKGGAPWTLTLGGGG